MKVPQNINPANKSNKSDSPISSNQNYNTQQSIINDENVVNMKDNLININEIFEAIKDNSKNKNKQLKYPYIVYNKKDKDVFATESSSEEKQKIIPRKKNKFKTTTLKKKIKNTPKENKEKKLNKKLNDKKVINDKKEKKIEEILLDEIDIKPHLKKYKSCTLIQLKAEKENENKNKNKQKTNPQSNQQINIISDNKKIINDNEKKITEEEKNLSYKHIFKEFMSNDIIEPRSKEVNNVQNNILENDKINFEGKKENNDINNNKDNKDNNHSNNKNENDNLNNLNSLNNLDNIKRKQNLNRKLLLSAKMNKNKIQINSKKMDMMLKKINYQRSLPKKIQNENHYNNKNYKSNNNKKHKSNNNDFKDYKEPKKINIESLKNLKNKNFLKYAKKYKPEISTHYLKKSKSTNKLKFPVINSILDDIEGLCRSILSNKDPENFKNVGIKYIPYNKHFGYEYWKKNRLRKKLVIPKTTKNRFESNFDIYIKDKKRNHNINLNAYNPYSLNWTKKFIENDYNHKILNLFNEDMKIRKCSSLTRGKSAMSYQNSYKNLLK